MKKRSLLILVIPVVLFLAMPSFAADAAVGKDAYMKKCATCHGQAGEGKDAMAKMLKITLAHLGSKEVQARSDAELQKIPLEGKGKMKPVKDLTPEMAADIIAFLRTLATK
jgi:cytochrome c